MTDVGDFIIIHSKLHDEFDAFKKNEVIPSHSFVPVNELLLLYCLPLFSNLVVKYGKCYFELEASEIDSLIWWIYEMRKKYKLEGGSVFVAGIQSLLSNG